MRVAVGTKEYDAIRESVAIEGVDYTMTPLTDPGFNEQQSQKVRELIAVRMRELPPADFSRDAALGDEARTSGCCSSTARCSDSAPGLFTCAIFGV